MKTATRGPHGGCVIRRAALSTKVRERFWSRVRKDESCWVWVGRLGPGGYGVFSAHAVRPGPLPAHRVAFALEHGETPAGLVVMHECDNKPCVNPAHLRVGTQGENQRDAIARGLIQFPGPHSRVGAFVQAVLLLHPTLSEIVSVSALPGRPNIIAMALGRGVSRGDMITAIGCSEALFSCFESGELYLMGDRRSRLVAYLNTLEPK